VIRILYVDDSPFDRALVRDALEREAEGFELTEAATREELEAVLESGSRFDLVLSDFNILGMTGLEVVKRIHRIYPRVPVILVTGTGSEEIAVQALKAGASDYVIKQPSHIRRLPQTIQATLESQEARLERDDALRELGASEFRYRLLAEHSADLITRLDRTGRVLYASPAVSTLLGLTPKELEGSLLTTHVIREDRDVVAELVARAGSPGSVAFPAQFRLAHSTTSEIRWMEATGRAIGADATLSGSWELQMALRDISDRKRMEASLEQHRARLEEAQRLEAVGRLAGGVAHDFNNLLTVIRSSAELILEGLAADHPLRLDAEEIARASARAGELTRHLVLFSSGDVAPTRETDPVPLLKETLGLLRRSLPSRIALETSIPESLPALRTNPARLQQVVLNLGLNARDAIEKEGAIEITVAPTPARDHLESWTGNDRPADDALLLAIRVSDNGSGMPPQVRTRVFEPFFTTKTMDRGTGLGLASAFGTVRQAGGTILVQSEEGRGSTFTVLLPFSPSAASASPGEHAPGDAEREAGMPKAASPDPPGP
jgi:two-component system, cell cycle sensor histidine kinase and response regulator CckA